MVSGAFFLPIFKSSAQTAIDGIKETYQVMLAGLPKIGDNMKVKMYSASAGTFDAPLNSAAGFESVIERRADNKDFFAWPQSKNGILMPSD